MKRRFIFITLALMIMASIDASPEELGRGVFEYDLLGSGYCAGQERILVELLGGCYIEFEGWLVCVECNLWPDTWLAPADVGTTMVATAATSPCFSSLAQTLTNNVNELCGVQVWMESYYQPGHTGCGSEWGGYEHDMFSLEGEDFYGATITSFAVRLDSLLFTTGSHPEMKDAYISLTWIVEGTWNDTSVEPSTWSRIKRMFSQ